MTFGVAPAVVVLDASAAMAFLGGDAGWIGVVRQWAEDDLPGLAPAHLPAEVANALLRGAGLGPVEAAARLERLRMSGAETTDRGLPGLLGAIELADRHRLSVYDALYLDLALDVDGELATLDRDLALAAAREGVTVTRP